MTSRLWYLVAFLVLVLGIGGAIFFAVSSLGGLQDALQRVVVPGESVVALDKGTYTIFHETTGTLDGVVYSASDISGLRISLQSADSGDAVQLLRPSANSTYSFGGSSGVSVFTFAIETPGAVPAARGLRRRPRRAAHHPLPQQRIHGQAVRHDLRHHRPCLRFRHPDGRHRGADVSRSPQGTSGSRSAGGRVG